LYYGKLSLEGEDFTYDIDTFLELSNVEWKEIEDQNLTFKSENMFW
jgi:hypothetical protein